MGMYMGCDNVEITLNNHECYYSKNEVLEQIKEKLIINVNEYDTQSGADFVYSCVGDENPQIECKLTYEHMKTVRDFLQLPYIEKRKPGRQSTQSSKTQDNEKEIHETTILSRDNFVNEYFTK